MKLTASSFLFVALLGAIVAGCGKVESRSAAEDASQDDFAAYEAAVAAAEGKMEANVDSSMEEDAATVEE